MSFSRYKILLQRMATIEIMKTGTRWQKLPIFESLYETVGTNVLKCVISTTWSCTGIHISLTNYMSLDYLFQLRQHDRQISNIQYPWRAELCFTGDAQNLNPFLCRWKFLPLHEWNESTCFGVHRWKWQCEHYCRQYLKRKPNHP